MDDNFTPENEFICFGMNRAKISMTVLQLSIITFNEFNNEIWEYLHYTFTLV